MKWSLLFIVLLMVLIPSALWAQGCSLCTKTASELDAGSAKGLNAGILYLAFLPLTILGVIGYFWWKSGKRAKAHS